MHKEFSTRLNDMLALEIKLKKKAAEDENLQRLYSIKAGKLPEVLIVRDTSGWLTRAVPQRDVAKMIDGLVKAARTGSFKAEDLKSLQSALTVERSFPRLILLHKLLEEIAVWSTNGKVWREAINTISLPLYNKVRFELNGTSRERLGMACLWNIYMECEGRKKAFTAEVMVAINKMAFVTDVFCGALFTDRLSLERKVLSRVLDIESTVVMAALTAYQMSRPQTSSPVFHRLTQEGICIDPEEGISQMMAIIKGDGYSAEITEVYRRVMLGMREILTIKEGPHPWFREGRNGLVPTFAKDGIQLNTFMVLGKIPSAMALATAMDAMAKLYIPHVWGVGNGKIEAEPSVKRAVGGISDTVSQLLLRSGALEHFHVSAFNGMFFGDNGGLHAAEVEESTLLLLGPALSRVSMVTREIGFSDAPLSIAASEGLIRGLLLGTEGKSREERAAVINRNVDIVMERQGAMFNGEDVLPNRDDTMRLIRKLVKNQIVMQRVMAPKPPKRLRSSSS